ncbi:MAG: CotH kinase family protein, partial [Candidatus Ventricola sp.]
LRVVWVDDYGYDYASDAVRDGVRYELLAYTDTEFAYFGVVFTGLPIVTLKIGGGTEALSEEYTAARMAVSGAGYEGVNSGALVHLRGGGYVKQYPKDSYRVELHTLSAHGDKKNDVSVLGMPADSDWLLIANASDDTCARNELAWSIWRDWNADGQGFMLLQSRMVEVFVEDEYVGLYQLMQRIRIKEEIVRMGGNPDTDYCARVINVANIGEHPVLDLVESVNIWAELRYAPQGVSARRSFAQYEPYWRMNVRSAENEMWLDDEAFAQTAAQCTDVRGMMDFFLFTQAAGLGYDNVFNNVYMWALKQGDHYVYYLSPWDMDMGFTKMFGGKKSGSAAYPYGQTSGEMPDAGATDEVEDTPNLYLQQARRMLDLDVAGARQILRDVWNEKRTTILTEDAMYQRFDAFQEMINASGAYLRESEKWHGDAQELNLATIQAFAVEHLHTIDLAIDNLWPLEGTDEEQAPDLSE